MRTERQEDKVSQDHGHDVGAHQAGPSGRFGSLADVPGEGAGGRVDEVVVVVVGVVAERVRLVREQDGGLVERVLCRAAVVDMAAHGDLGGRCDHGSRFGMASMAGLEYGPVVYGSAGADEDERGEGRGDGYPARHANLKVLSRC